MHLYPARLGSALPASVARQSSPPCPSFSLSRPLLRSPSYIRFFFFFVRLASSALSRATKSLHEPSDAEEKGRGGGGGGGRSTFLPKETRACRALLFPTLLCFSTELHATEKDQVHPAEMHSRFPIRIGDKNVTLLECCGRTRDRFVTLTLCIGVSIKF